MSRHILLIQDDVARAKAIHAALSASNDGSFHVEWVRTCSAGLERLSRSAAAQQKGAGDIKISAVLVDLSLPDSQGIETFDRLFRAISQIPILVLATSQDEAIAKIAVQHGAQDYLMQAHLDGHLLPKTLVSMIERAANSEALYEEKERAQVTLNSIGDAVMSTDLSGHVTYLNVIAEGLTGWSQQEAVGRPLHEVFLIIDATTREVAVNPMELAIRENKLVALTPNCVLIRRDGVKPQSRTPPPPSMIVEDK